MDKSIINETEKHLSALRGILTFLGNERDGLLGLAVNLMVELGKEKVILNVGDFDFAKEYALFIKTDEETREVIVELRRLGGKNKNVPE